MILKGHLIVVVASFLMGCAMLLVVGVSGVQATATEEQGDSDDRCEGTRFVVRIGARYTTNDVPGCPSGGLLSGSDVDDELAGVDGDDEIRGFGALDSLLGGEGNDVIYGGPGDDELDGGQDDDVIYGGDGADGAAFGPVYGGPGDDVIYGGDGNDDFIGEPGEDVFYGGDGNDFLDGRDRGVKDTQRDELYCGKGRDQYLAGSIDYVVSSCEEAAPFPLVDTGGAPMILPAGALLLGAGLLLGRSVIRRVP
jgi:Ca2+-binding RTX toxin-like protein